MNRSDEYTGTMIVRDDEGNELEWDMLTSPGSGLKYPESPDGRQIYSTVEGEFFFEREPDRIYRPAAE